MKKIFIVLILLCLTGCSVKEKKTISEEETNLRYLSAAQLYSLVTIFYPPISMEKANEDYLNLLESIKNGASDFEYARNKEMLLNSTLSLHNIYSPSTSELMEIGVLPVRLIYNEGKFYVKQISEGSSIPKFVEIISVNGVAILEWLEIEYPSIYLQCNTNNDFNYLISYLESGYLGDKVTLEYAYNGEVIKEELGYEKGRRWLVGSGSEINIDTIYKTSITFIGVIDDVVYIKVYNFVGLPSELYFETLDQLFDEYDKVIFDLRGNSGGNSSYGMEYIFPVLSNDFNSIGVQYHNYSSEDKGYGLGGVYGESMVYKSGTVRYEVEAKHDLKVVVLIDQTCVSACEAIAYYESQQENAILMGENTGGQFSQITTVELADGSSVTISVEVGLVGGVMLNSIGVAPDIVIDFGRIYLSEGTDAILTDALEYLEK